MEHSLSMPGVKMTPMQYVHDYALITFGLLCYAVGFTCFILPYQITTGAVAGIFDILCHTRGFPCTLYVSYNKLRPVDSCH